jgi:hypothetical protein
VEEIPDPSSVERQPAQPAAVRDDDRLDRFVDELAGAFRALLTIEGVEGIGQPVTVISPGDLPPEFLGFVERLRAGAIELDEETILITIPASRGRRRKTHPVRERLRQSLHFLCRYATDKGVSVEDLGALPDEARRKLGPHQRGSRDQRMTAADPGQSTSRTLSTIVVIDRQHRGFGVHRPTPSRGLGRGARRPADGPAGGHAADRGRRLPDQPGP